MTDEEKRKQVAAQCRAVSHMANSLAQIYSDYDEMFERGCMDSLIDQVGKRTAAWMETLGDMLNSIDAVTKEDEWMTPVFEEANRLWPQE